MSKTFQCRGGAQIGTQIPSQKLHDSPAIIGKTVHYEAVPWFWSNQYDLKLQTIGLSMGHGATVIRGDPARRSFSLIYLKQGRVIALDCVNATRDFVQGRKLVVDRRAPDPAALADLNLMLRDISG